MLREREKLIVLAWRFFGGGGGSEAMSSQGRGACLSCNVVAVGQVLQINNKETQPVDRRFVPNQNIMIAAKTCAGGP